MIGFYLFFSSFIIGKELINYSARKNLYFSERRCASIVAKLTILTMLLTVLPI
jgi:hypothetical protein